MSTSRNEGDDRSSTTRLVDSVDQMFRLPLEMGGATWDLFIEGMERMSGRRWSSSRRRSRQSSTSDDDGSESGETLSSIDEDDRDLSGDDLKYVAWSIVFTKPDFECVLEPQHEEIVNYSADGPSFAALKIAKLLERARHGHMPKPDAWGDKYPPSSKTTDKHETAERATSAPGERGWRIPSEDHKYIKFLYRVDHRLPKQEAEVERVTIERGGTTKVY